MEEDEREGSSSLPKWVLLEYTQMLTLAGKPSKVLFTHLSSSSCSRLKTALAPSEQDCATSQVHEKGVIELMKEEGVDLSRVCLLDPKAEKKLSPEDGNGEFAWFLFGVCSANYAFK